MIQNHHQTQQEGCQVPLPEIETDSRFSHRRTTRGAN
ncbi:hypothetical protein SPLC1_S490450 [Arthrospira platensis C1]|nr:hypothetical protein SPLC1_S490450 [Arthrospira platensis C1]